MTPPPIASTTSRFAYSLRVFPVLLLIFVMISGCSLFRPKPVPKGPDEIPKPHEVVPPTPSRAEIDAQRESQLRAFIARWGNVDYKWGGCSMWGVDCSCFVQIAMYEVFGIHLPRTTEGQIDEGRSVHNIDELRSGDLVFFNIEDKIKRKQRHVAIFLGNGEIGHVTVTKGVTTSRLGSPYWYDSYLEGRRVLD